jgi:hypothetical protein
MERQTSMGAENERPAGDEENGKRADPEGSGVGGALGVPGTAATPSALTNPNPRQDVKAYLERAKVLIEQARGLEAHASRCVRYNDAPY